MGQWVVEDVPTDQVTSFCRLQKAIGATECTGTEKEDGLSDVLVVFPDKESFSDHQGRLNG
jgi:hypothetical protein